MRLKLSAGLRYPITVTDLLKQPPCDVARNQVLFRFKYDTTRPVDDEFGETYQEAVTFFSQFESEAEGTLQKWLIRKDQVIHQPMEVAEIEEACPHDLQFAGTCLKCGKDTTITTGYNATQKDADRANVNMVHDNNLLRVAPSVAIKAENEAKRRLVTAKRLILVVDLDMTVIHATVDPTVAEWQQDPENPNYESVKDVQSFRLKDGPPSTNETTYYIKMRPGLQHFLEQVSKIYELHIYTMGTRAYAKAVAKIIDPDKKFFGDRILSRDESGSMVAKNLQRLFPVDQKMVVIIDDRSDVWRWSRNLIRVSQFDFFTGSGDINASFLPPKPKIQVTPGTEMGRTLSKRKSNGTTNGDTNGNANGDESALEALVEMSGGEDDKEIQAKTEKAAQTLENQVKERPLAQKQLALDQKDEVESQEDANKDGSSDKGQRHSLLETHDQELMYIESALRKVHQEFYEQYSQNMVSIAGGRLGELRGTQKAEPSDSMDLERLPDVQDVMSAIKQRVLGDCSAVFSGVVPIETPIRTADICVWAMSFGLSVRDNLRKSTTHVIAVKKGTAKVKLALRQGKGKMKVVNTQWLMDSILRWKKQDESAYMLHSEDDYISPLDARTGVEGDEADVLSDSDEPLDETLTDGDTTDTEKGRPALKIRVKPKRKFEDTDLENDTDDDFAPGSPYDDKSPIGGDQVTWEGMDDELAEFMGDGDSDEESVASAATSRKSDGSRTPLPDRKSGSKRRLEEIGGDEDDDGPRKRSKDKEEAVDEGDEFEDQDWDAMFQEDEEEEGGDAEAETAEDGANPDTES